jgi:hypothetical protein
MIETSVSIDAFLTFAKDATLNLSTIKAIVDSNVEVTGEDGEVRSIAYAVVMQKPVSFNKGDVLTMGAKSYELQDIIVDDDILITVSAL